MRETEKKSTVLTLGDGQEIAVQRGGLVAHFNAESILHVSHNGQTVAVYDAKSGLMVTPHVANDRPIDAAPAVLWHRINGRLTDKDIATTICDDKDNPIGIYTGVWTPEWAKGGEIRTYAAITDARNENGDRLSLTFNEYVAHLYTHPNGEKLLDRPSDARDVTYEMAMQARILALKPGEFTGQMIPTYELLRGQKYPGQAVTHRNNMYDLRHTGDFAKSDNGGYDSRFVTETGSGHAHCYVSSTENHDYRAGVFGAAFTVGNYDWVPKGADNWSLRPFVAEIALK